MQFTQQDENQDLVSANLLDGSTAPTSSGPPEPLVRKTNLYLIGASAVAHVLGFKNLAALGFAASAADIVGRQISPAYRAKVAGAALPGYQDLVDVRLNGYRGLVQLPSLGFPPRPMWRREEIAPSIEGYGFPLTPHWRHF